MSKIKRISIVLLLFLTVLVSTGYFLRKKITAHFTPSVEQVGEISMLIKNDTCYLSSLFSVTNRSCLHIRIDTLRYSVSFFGKIYIESKEYTGISLPGNSSDSMVISLKIPYRKIMNDFKSERMKKDRTTYAIIILVDYSTFLGNNDVLITKSKRLQIPQPPELEIIEIKYNNVHLKSIKAKVKIRVTNNGPIDLHVTGMKYYITLRGQGKVSGRYAPGIDILPYGTTIVDLPVEINPKKISRTLLDVITNNDTYDYSLNVNAVLSLPDQPGQTFHVDLVKTGRIELKK